MPIVRISDGPFTVNPMKTGASIHRRRYGAQPRVGGRRSNAEPDAYPGKGHLSRVPTLKALLRRTENHPCRVDKTNSFRVEEQREGTGYPG
jgi:hypothetical protein